jgi:integrase
MDDKPENWALLEPIRTTLGKLIERGKDPTPTLDAFFHGAGTESSTLQPTATPLGPTVKSYATDVFLPYNQPPRVRKAQARDYRRHLKIVIDALGDLPLATLEPSDIRGLQAELIDRKLSTKYVKNIVSGSFRAMIQQALDDRVLVQDPFPRKLKWPRWHVPPADPFTDEERERIEVWFREKRFGLRPGPGTTRTLLVAHPPYPALVHVLLWTGLRPSEAAGLQWQDIDLERGRLHVQRSRHLYEDGAPKTASADRWVQLFPKTVNVLRSIQPLRVEAEQYVFTTTEGKPVEPKAFASRYWYRCLRGLGIRVRGIYCTKDTYVSSALKLGAKVAWLEQQTGVNYATLKRHYAKWLDDGDDSDLRLFEALDPSLFADETPKIAPRDATKRGQFPQTPRKSPEKRCEEGDLNPKDPPEISRKFSVPTAKDRHPPPPSVSGGHTQCGSLTQPSIFRFVAPRSQRQVA